MFLLNILVSLLVCSYTSLANKDPGMGYLLINISRTPHCYDLVENEFCPPDVIDYKVVDFDSEEEMAKYALQSVNISLNLLNFFPSVSEACRDSVREYSCSNVFAVCTPDSHGIDLKYDVHRTEAACARIKSNCPEIVQQGITHNCSLIQKDPADYGYCFVLPEVQGDVCTKSHYKYPKALGNFYKVLAKDFPENLAQLVKDKLFTNSSCEQEFVDVYCQFLRGTICSTDMVLRMYAISQQDCASTFTKCLSGKVPAIKNYFLQMCKFFPDANTAKRVPLPPVAGGNN